MDASRCVIIEFDGASQETLLKYLWKNDLSYNWIVTAFDEIRVCIWWAKNVEFSTTPLRSFLKRFKNKMPIDSYFKISRKMSTEEGVRKVYDGNGPVMLTLDTLQGSSICYLTNPVREHVIGLRLQEPNNEEPGNFFEPSKEEEPVNEEPTPLRVGNPPMVDKDREFKLDISNKVDLLLKFTARITTEVKKISKLVEDMIKDKVMDDTPLQQLPMQTFHFNPCNLKLWKSLHRSLTYRSCIVIEILLQGSVMEILVDIFIPFRTII